MKKLITFFREFPYRRLGKAIINMLAALLHKILFHWLLPKKYRGASKKTIYTVIFRSDTPAGKKFDIYLLIAIGINLVLLMVESSPRITGWWSISLRILEWLFTLGFTFEYYLRCYCLKRPLKYVFSLYGVIDFLSIFPAYLSLIFPAMQSLTVLRVLRALRIFRILKMQKFLDESARLLQTLRRSAYRVAIFMLFTFLIAVILGALMYMFENGHSDSFRSIPEGIYWAVVTITTVGYGDVAPVTMAGRFISIIVMLLGYSIIAVPTGIVAGEVVKEKRYRRPEVHEGFSHADDADTADDDAVDSTEEDLR